MSATTHSFTRAAVVVVVLSAVLLAETSWFGRRHSLTYDETIYLNLAIRSVHDRRLDGAYLTMGVAPLPALIAFAGPLLFKDVDPRPSVDTGRLEDPYLIRAPRFLNALLIAVPLVITVFWWLKRRRGLEAATLGGGLIALSPTILANGSIATTDLSLALFSTLGMAAIAWCAAAPGVARLLVCAVALAAAMSAKYSGAFLLPVAAGVFLLSSITSPSAQSGGVSARRAIGKSIAYSVGLVCLVLPLWWGLHLFTRATPEQLATLEQASESDLPAPGSARGFVMSLAPIAGLRHQLRHNWEGETAFLMGEQSNRGWWYYFPLVFLFKSTPAELSLALVMIVSLLAALRHPWRKVTTLDSTQLCLLLSAVTFGGLLLTSHLDLGLRYAIPLYPILILAASDRLSAWLRHRRGWFAAAAAILLASQAWSSFSIAPHYLAYVNRMSGGPEHAWRLFADSNLDWGQDLPDLQAVISARGLKPTVIKYFGTALPEAYGVEADDMERLRRAPEEYATLAVSATYLNGLYLGNRDPFKALRGIEPVAGAGHSIMLYDLRRADAQAAFREALKVLH